MTLYSRESARRSLIDTVAYRLLSQVATVASYVILVRAMAQQEFGVYNLLYAFLPVVNTAASLGMEDVVRRYQPEYLRSRNLPAAFWLVRFVASARFGANLVVLGLMLVGWAYFAPLFKLGPYRVQFLLFCAVVLLHFQAQILHAALGSHMLHRFSVGAVALLAYCKVAGYGALALAGNLTLEAAILVDAAGYGLAWMLMRRAYAREATRSGVREMPAYRPDSTERRRLLRYGLYHNFNDAGGLFLSSRSDNFFIAAIIDPLSVAVYSFYTRLNEMVAGLLPVRLFENVVNPMFFAMSREDATRKVPGYFSLLMNLNLLLQWPVLAFTVAYHREIVEVVFAGNYVEYSWLMPLVAAFSTCNAIAIPVTMVARYYERAGVILASKVFAIANIVLLVLLVRYFGLAGAAVSTGLATTAKNGFIWWFVRKEAVWLGAWRQVAGSLLFWGLVVAITAGFKSLIPDVPLLNLAFGALVFGVAGFFFLRGPALSDSDRVTLSGLLKVRDGAMLQRLGRVLRLA